MTETAIQESRGFQPTNLAELKEMATMMSKSNMVPKDFQNRPMDILVASQFGSELGLGMLASLQNIAVINGRPAIWGDAALALVQAHPDCEGVVEEVDREAGVATCTAKRKGRPDVVRVFSMDDAKTAGLAGRNVWKQYPWRMLQMRARGFALRDQWADALKGISIAEEARDAEVIQVEAAVSDAGRGLSRLETTLIAPSTPIENVVGEAEQAPEAEETQDQGKAEEPPAKRTKPARASKKKPAKATKTKAVETGVPGVEENMFPPDAEDEKRAAVVRKIYAIAKSLDAKSKEEVWAVASDYFGKVISGPSELALFDLESLLSQFEAMQKGQ